MHYYADNGRFVDKEFIDTIANKRQTVSFCDVNAHFQNGKAEKRIRDLHDQARKVLLHSVARWSKSSSTHLWLYAVHYVNDERNNIPTSENAQSPLQKFTGTSVQTKVNAFHTFGCPVYALDRGLASGKNIPKWNPRCILGLYLDNSPRHAPSVSQVLNLDIGRVSPQYHVIHDELFETISLQDKIRTNWKRLAGFTPVQLSVSSPPNITPPLAIVPSDPPPITPQEPDEYIPPPDAAFEPLNEQPTEQVDVSSPHLRCSTRIRQPTRTILESVTQQNIEFHDFLGPYTSSTIAFNTEHQTYY